MEADLDFLNDLRPQPEAETATEAIIRLIDDDKVVPIVGNALINDLMISNHEALVNSWAHMTIHRPNSVYHPQAVAKVP